MTAAWQRSIKKANIILTTTWLLRFGTMELMFATKYPKSKSTSTLKKSRKTYLIFLRFDHWYK